MHEHFTLHQGAPEAVHLPDSAQGCRERMAALQGEIASIRIQIATTDIRRQTEKKTLDAAWFHRAKTALRLKQQELAQVMAHLATFDKRAAPKHRDAFKDTLIEVVRENCNDQEWAGLVQRARDLHASQEKTMAELPVITSLTREAIFSGYEADASDGFRSHLGASLIGKECERALWYDFRWVTRSKHPGRLLRLFETGQLEEARMVLNLRRTGATVLEVDPETGRQFRVQAHGGHFGGSLDGLAINLLEAPKSWHVLEFKTHSNKSFGDLVAKKVRESKPQHFAQMQIYMHLMGITRAMYLAVNKDTDDLHVERVEADVTYAELLLEKARRIIFAQTPLPRISEEPSWYQCRMCDHAPVCHASGNSVVAPAINCRTCLHSTPVDGGWHCDRHQKRLTEVDQRTGCEQHLYLPPLVPATQVDAGDDWVDYEFSNGVRWRDAGLNKHAAN